MQLTTFVLVGSILSHDSFLATVEFQMNPAVNGGPAIAVLPVEAIPCEVKVGQGIYVVKNEKEAIPIITCKKKEQY